MRPIDADALKDFINRQLAMTASTAVVMNAKDFFENIVDNAPTIDAVPVVRCKDCKHWGMHKSLNVPWCFEMHIDKSEDGFCDIGERIEDGET